MCVCDRCSKSTSTRFKLSFLKGNLKQTNKQTTKNIILYISTMVFSSIITYKNTQRLDSKLVGIRY